MIREFELQEPQPDGQSLRKHLEVAAESTGSAPARLVEHGELPLGYGHLWEWLKQLSRTRTIGLVANAISYTEIAAWAALTGNRPTPFEVAILVDMDAALIAHQAQQKTKAQPHG